MGRGTLRVVLALAIVLFAAAPAQAAEVPQRVVRASIPAAARATPIGWQVPPATLPVSLTFDDGPNETFTPQILDILARHRVTATFFVLGSAVERSPDLARRIVAEGHRLANHSWDHANLTAVGLDVLDEEVNKTTAAITAATGVVPLCLRPPFGRINDAVRAEARASGLAISRWSMDTRDYERPGVPTVISRALTGAVPGGVILFHDSGPDMSQTVAALPSVIQGIQSRGLRIAPIC